MSGDHNMNQRETTKHRTERLMGMSRGELVMHCQDLTLQRDEITEDRNTWKARAEFSYQQRDKLEGGKALEECRRIDAERQRDELLAALEHVHSAWVKQFEGNVHLAPKWALEVRDAIASVKGD